ncbi:MAG: Xaa-Pro peptidase family protein [Candidatus Omnitrophota bacterium]
MSTSSIVNKIRAKVRSGKIDALFVTDENNIRYLTGFYFAGMVLAFKGKGSPICFVDAMNSTLAEKLLRDRKSDIKMIPGSIRKTFTCFVNSEKIENLGYDDGSISVREYEGIIKLLPKTRFISVLGGMSVAEVFESLREIKTPDEIEILRTAAKKTISIWRKAKKNIGTGMSEIEIASMIDILTKEAGYDNSFHTIAAIGQNTAYPHAIPAKKNLKMGEHVLVDFGIRYKGYCSDLTRVYLNGRIDRQITGLIDCVRRAQDEAIKIAKDGVKISTMAEVTSKVFRASNLSDLTLHGLGHGVGLEVHEKPFLRVKCPERLKKGMVLAIEPGLYREGLGGARKEDMVLIKEKGCEVLTI